MSAETPTVFTADHPFNFYMYDEQAQTVLMSGRVNKPDEVTQADLNRLPVIAQSQSQSPQQSNISQPAQPTKSWPSQIISFPPQSRPYPSPFETLNGQRYEPNRHIPFHTK